MSNFIGINVIGHISGNLGLAVSARNIVGCLIKRGVQLRLLNIDPGMNRDNFDTTYNELFVQSLDQLIFPINLFILPPTEYTIDFINFFKGKFNVAYAYWELPHLPEKLKENLSRVDALVAPSSFTFETYGREVNCVHIIKAKTPYLYDFNKVNSIRSGEDKFKVFTSFEPHSDLLRKNPYLAIECFQKAYSESENVELTVKVNNAYIKNSEELHPVIQSLINHCSSDDRIVFDFKSYSHDELMQYFQTFDLAISLHRAEGFGLMPLEMMALGVPVISTNWSGNMDYMNSKNSFLVRHKMIDANGSMGVYQAQNYKCGTQWADPLIEDAINYMRLAFNNDISDMSINARYSALKYIREANELEFIDEINSIFRLRDFNGNSSLK